MLIYGVGGLLLCLLSIFVLYCSIVVLFIDFMSLLFSFEKFMEMGMMMMGMGCNGGGVVGGYSGCSVLGVFSLWLVIMIFMGSYWG